MIPSFVCIKVPLENFKGSSFPGKFKHSQSRAASNVAPSCFKCKKRTKPLSERKNQKQWSLRWNFMNFERLDSLHWERKERIRSGHPWSLRKTASRKWFGVSWPSELWRWFHRRELQRERAWAYQSWARDGVVVVRSPPIFEASDRPTSGVCFSKKMKKKLPSASDSAVASSLGPFFPAFFSPLFLFGN